MSYYELLKEQSLIDLLKYYELENENELKNESVNANKLLTNLIIKNYNTKSNQSYKIVRYDKNFLSNTNAIFYYPFLYSYWSCFQFILLKITLLI